MEAHDVNSVIKTLELIPHPEGGYFREVYKSEEFIGQNMLPSRYNGNRSFLTSIYYLLKNNDVSQFHILLSDEVWYFHIGSPVIIHQIIFDGNYNKYLLGSNYLSEEKLHVVVKRNTWFGAEIRNKNSFSLVNCAIAPGFEFSDFKLADRNELLAKYPQHTDLIIRLT
jgi:predicted cupin superfamily sugar epimerase